MNAKLPDELRHALESGGGRPLEVQDEQNSRVYYLLNEEAYLHLQGLQSEQEQLCQERLRHLIEKGMKGPDVPSEKVFADLRALAAELSQANS